MSDSSNAQAPVADQPDPKPVENVAEKGVNDVAAANNESSETASPAKKRRSKGPHKTIDELALAEAKAVCGDVDTSSGRQLRKREPPPEPKPKQVKRAPSKKEPAAKKTKTDKVTEEKKDEETESKPENSVDESSATAKVKPNESGDGPAQVKSDELSGTADQKSTAPAVSPVVTPAASLPAAEAPVAEAPVASAPVAEASAPGTIPQESAPATASQNTTPAAPAESVSSTE